MSYDLELTKNMQFYKIKSSLDDDLLSEVLDQAVSNKEQGIDFILDVYRDIRSTNSNLEYKVTIKVFPTVRPVYFLKNIDLKDRIFAYVVLIELNNYLIVMSKSCANFSQVLNKNFDLIITQELSKLFGKNVEFQKLSLRNMTISDKAVRNRSYEAANLKGTLSTHAAGRSIPSHIKVRDGSNLKSISSTGRVVESSSRQSLNKIVEWVHEQIKLLETASSNEFLNLFARKVQLSDVLKVTKPAALLVDVSFIEDELLSENIKIKWQTSKRVKGERKKQIIEKYLKENIKNILLDKLRKVYEIDGNNNILGSTKSSKIKINSKSLTISTKYFSKFKVEENSKIISLMSYINKKGLYSITFEDPKYMYFIDHCFEDVSGESEIDSILDILVPKSGIDKMVNEKGNFKKNQKKFSENSMFCFVEKMHSKDNHIFCDDLGDEWADHITFNLSDPSINFIHSKHGKKSTSASNLHDVVGQGLKNLGNMFFNKEQFVDKINKSMCKNYVSSKGIATSIYRVRKSNNSLESELIDLLKRPQLHRKCILSCSFISKQEIEKEFNKLKNKQKVKGNIVQLLWIISSFSHAAKEANVIPIIYCAD